MEIAVRTRPAAAPASLGRSLDTTAAAVPLFGTAMLQTFLVAAMARRGWLPPGSILSSVLRVPAGYAAILIASLWWARRLRADGDEGVCLRTGNDVDRPPTQAGA